APDGEAALAMTASIGPLTGDRRNEGDHQASCRAREAQPCVGAKPTWLGIADYPANDVGAEDKGGDDRRIGRGSPVPQTPGQYDSALDACFNSDRADLCSPVNIVTVRHRTTPIYKSVHKPRSMSTSFNVSTRSVKIPSTPASISPSMISESLTVQTCTFLPARWAASTSSGVGTESLCPSTARYSAHWRTGPE